MMRLLTILLLLSLSFGTVTNIDGNVYETVVIGEQMWMAENLKVTHYRNGDEIPTGYSNSEWMVLETGAYGVYPIDNDNAAQTTCGDDYADVYGNLYNWNNYNAISMDVTCRSFDIPSPKEGEVKGETVAKAYEDGNIEAVNDYVMRDVEATHQLFKKLRQYIK